MFSEQTFAQLRTGLIGCISSLDSGQWKVTGKTYPNTHTHLRWIFPPTETLGCQLWVASLSYSARWAPISCRSFPTLFLPLWMDERFIVQAHFLSNILRGSNHVIRSGCGDHCPRNHTHALMYACHETTAFQTSTVPFEQFVTLFHKISLKLYCWYSEICVILETAVPAYYFGI